MYHLIHIQILSPKVKALLPKHSKQMRTHALAFIPPRIATFIPLVPSSPRVLLHISLIPNAYSCLCIHTATLPLHSYHLTNFIHTTHTREPNHLSGHHDCHHHLRPPCSQKKKNRQAGSCGEDFCLGSRDLKFRQAKDACGCQKGQGPRPPFFRISLDFF